MSPLLFAIGFSLIPVVTICVAEKFLGRTLIGWLTDSEGGDE
jgi:hypothetical protein